MTHSDEFCEQLISCNRLFILLIHISAYFLGRILKVINDSFQNATSDNTGIQLSAVQSARFEHTHTHTVHVIATCGHSRLLLCSYCAMMIIFDHLASHDSLSSPQSLEFSRCFVVCTHMALRYQCLLLLINAKWENVISRANK